MEKHASRAFPAVLVLEAFLSALVFSHIIAKYAWPKPFLATPLDQSLRAAVFALGTLAGLVAAGLVQPQRTNRKLFLLGLGATSISLCTTLLQSLYIDGMTTIVHTFATCAASSLVTIAWSERISSYPGSHRLYFLTAHTLFIVLITTAMVCMPAQGVIPIMEIAATAAIVLEVALLSLPRDAEETGEGAAGGAPVALSRHLLVIFFLFGFLQSSLCLIYRFQRPDILHADIGFFFCYFPLLLAATFFFLFFFQKRPGYIPFIAPLACLGLLIPPLFALGMSNSLHLSIVFTIACDVIVWSSGSPAAAQVIRLPRIRPLYLYQRSWGQIGKIVGYVLFFYILRQWSAPAENTAGLAFVATYAVVSLPGIAVLERMGMKAGRAQQPGRPPLPGFQQEGAPAPGPAALDELCARHALTNRERQVLRLLSRGRSIPYIQNELGISPGTAATHVNHIYQKLGVHTRQELFDLLEAAGTKSP